MLSNRNGTAHERDSPATFVNVGFSRRLIQLCGAKLFKTSSAEFEWRQLLGNPVVFQFSADSTITPPAHRS